MQQSTFLLPNADCKIPSINKLYEQLLLDNTNKKSKKQFFYHLHRWRRTYKTSDGRKGSALIFWKDRETQEALSEVAGTFYESKREMFWSRQNLTTQISYRIKAILKQIVWRQNKYAAINENYSSTDIRLLAAPQSTVTEGHDTKGETSQSAPSSEPTKTSAASPTPTSHSMSLHPARPNLLFEERIWIVKSKTLYLGHEQWKAVLFKDTTLGFFTQKVANLNKCPHVKELKFILKTHKLQFTDSVSENDEEGFVDLKKRIDEKIEEALKRGERSYSILVEPSDIEEGLKDKSFEMEDAELQDF
ncbi:hypothetical protein B0J14DRAFT_567839 [Halenospora varia]|nr:hypothetical protein B0J14DRAFT_567839 [Halenospora varia]